MILHHVQTIGLRIHAKEEKMMKQDRGKLDNPYRYQTRKHILQA